MMGGYKMIILLAFLVDGVFGADPHGVITNMSVIEGGLVTLNSGVIKKQEDIMQWYFNNILIAHINGDPKKTCFYYGKGEIFKDRLEMDYETGSLIITDIRSEHTGRYEAEHIKSDSSGTGETLKTTSICVSTKENKKLSSEDIIKTFSVTVTAPSKAEPQMDIKEQETDKTVPGSVLSSGVVAGIVAAVLLVFAAAAAVGVIYSLRNRSRKRDEEIRKPELLSKVEV